MVKKTPNFEKALSELETLVEDMEQGNLSLEESLKRLQNIAELFLLPSY